MESDTGVTCLSILAHYSQVATDPAQLRHQFAEADKPCTDVELLRAARAVGFKARQTNLNLDQPNNSLLPVMAGGPGGRYFIIARASGASNAHRGRTAGALGILSW